MAIEAGPQKTDKWTPKRVAEKLKSVNPYVIRTLIEFYRDDLPKGTVNLDESSSNEAVNLQPQLVGLLRRAMINKKLVPRAVWYSARKFPPLPRFSSPEEHVQTSDKPVFELLLQTYLPKMANSIERPTALSLGCGLNLEGRAALDYLRKGNPTYAGTLIGIDKDPEQVLAGQELWRNCQDARVYFVCADILSQDAMTGLQLRLDEESHLWHGDSSSGEEIDLLVMRNFPITPQQEWRTALQQFEQYLKPNAGVVLTTSTVPELDAIVKAGLPSQYELLRAERNRVRVLNFTRDQWVWTPESAADANQGMLHNHINGVYPYEPQQTPTSFFESKRTDRGVVIAVKKE